MTTEKALIVPNESDTQALAQWAVESKRYLDIKTKDDAVAKIVIGSVLGVTPLMSLQTIYLVDNNVGLEAQLIKKKLREHGVKWTREYFDKQGQKINEKTDADKIWGISITMSLAEREDETYIFTLAHAAQANLLNKNNWKNYPSLMLYHRCITIGARDYCPEALHGMAYTKEELESTPAEIVKIEKPDDLVEMAKKQLGAEVVSRHPNYPKLNKAYGVDMGNCWEHGDKWEITKFKNSQQEFHYHKMPSGRCYFYQVIRPIANKILMASCGKPAFEQVVSEKGKYKGQMVWQITDALKEQIDWRNVSEYEHCEFLESLIID